MTVKFLNSIYSHHLTVFRIRIILLLLIASTTVLFGQNRLIPPIDSGFCKTPVLSPQRHKELEKQAQLALKLKRTANKAIPGITFIPVRPHIFRRSDGSGGFDLNRLNNTLALTNRYFLNHGDGIQFYFCGSTPDFIDDDNLFRQFDDEKSITGRDVRNALNMYFVNAFSSPGLGGYAYFPDKDTLETTRTFILTGAPENEYDLGNRLIPHELGHTFYLYHTFEIINGIELTTRGDEGNCAMAGDLVCDTPADPYLRSGSQVTYIDGCPTYTGRAIDPAGSPYEPSLTNIMSYYFPCSHDFTNGQYDRIQAGLALRQTHTSYSMDCPPTDVQKPTDVVVTRGASNNAIITWKDNAANETGYFIERSKAIDGPFVPIGGTGPNVTGFTDTEISLDGTYYYRVRPSNTTNAAVSLIASVKLSAITTCRPLFAQGCHKDDGLAAFTINEYQLSKASGCSPNSYQEFLPSSVTLTPGQQCVLKGDFLNQLYYEGTKIWLDANRDGLFTSDEEIYKGINKAGFTGEFTVPGNLTEGSIGLRVMVQKNTIPKTGCDTLNYGEAEDYVLVIAGSACKVPTGLQSVYLTASSVQLSWEPVVNASQYELSWRRRGENSWSVNKLTGTSFVITGSSAVVSYEWRVRSLCADGYSNYNGRVIEGICKAPVNLLAKSITGQSAELTWSGGQSGQRFDIAWKADIESEWHYKTGLYTDRFMLTDLRQGTLYEWQVRAYCDDQQASAYTTPAQFQTSGLCLPSISCQTGYGLNKFALNNIVLSKSSGCKPNGYASFGDNKAQVVIGEKVSFSGELLTSRLTNLDVWIDLNRNGIFDSAEHVYRSPGVVNPEFEGVFTIPAMATPGPAQMRVIACRGQYADDPCGAYAYGGETEDYSIDLVSVQTAFIVKAPDQACKGLPFTISLNLVAPDYAYKVEVSDKNGSFAGIPYIIGEVNPAAPTTVTAIIPAGLEPGKNYKIRLTNRISGESSPHLEKPLEIITNCTCDAPVPVEAKVLSGQMTEIIWKQKQNVEEVLIEYRPVNKAVWETVYVKNDTSYVFSVLSSDSQYEWRVTSACRNGNSSLPSGIQTFRTPDCGTAILSGSQSILPGQAASLTLTFSGKGNAYIGTIIHDDFPVGGVLIGAFFSQTNVITVSPSRTTAYSLIDATNSECGTMKSISDAVVTLPCASPWFATFRERISSTSTAELLWMPDWNMTYIVQWKEATATDWTTVYTRISGGLCSLQGLTYGKQYQWRVRTNCPNDSQSPWSAVRTFVMSCPVLTLQSALLSPTSVHLSWSWPSNAQIPEITLQWRQKGLLKWNTVNLVNAGMYKLSGLTSGEYYEWRIKMNCADQSTDYSAIQTFKTKCEAPVTWGGYYPTVNTISISWVGEQGSQYWIRWRELGTTKWFEDSTRSTTYTFTGLAYQVFYEWQLRATCSEKEKSDFSASDYGATACPVPFLLQTLTVNETAASILWYSRLNNSFVVRWRLSGTKEWTTSPPMMIEGKDLKYSYLIESLKPGMLYECQVNMFCEEGVWSDFTDSVFFTTKGACSDIFSIQSGRWDDPLTWSCGRIPTDSDEVTISAGNTVNLPENSIGYAKRLRIQAAGKLLYSVNSKLWLRY